MVAEYLVKRGAQKCDGRSVGRTVLISHFALSRQRGRKSLKIIRRESGVPRLMRVSLSGGCKRRMEVAALCGPRLSVGSDRDQDCGDGACKYRVEGQRGTPPVSISQFIFGGK